jgi:two-component system nitrogen regulation response regulator GlnG/two-component system response regulator HydG
MMNVLLADTDKSFVQDVVNSWSLQDVQLTAVSETSKLIESIENNPIHFAFVNADLLLHQDLDLISFLKEHHPGIEIIVLCEAKTKPAAESAMSRGATGYLLKPVTGRLLEDTAKKYLIRLRNNTNYRFMEDHVLENLLGDTPEMRKILKTLYKIAPTTSTILITGESGSGKEFVGNIVHRLSKRSNEPFIAVNCGAIPENLVESELFGSKKGSFTGANTDKKGLFEEAAGGTLFLDEVAELSPATQVKLLRFLQNHEIRRVGETETRYIDVRVIAATNKDLQEAMAEKQFREDLYYRLNTFHIHLPPLRERRVVIPSLVKYFILKYQQEHGKSIASIQPAAQMALTTYSYPGNIRELQNIIEHAIVLSENGEIRLEDLPDEVHSQVPSAQGFLPAPKPLSTNVSVPKQEMKNPGIPALTFDSTDDIIRLDEMEKQHILHALAILKGNKTEVANRLGISRATLWRKLKEHSIEMDSE